MSTIASGIKDDEEIFTKCFTESDIQRFYAGKTVFVTGATGYMGQCLVEKILRGCPAVRRIYLLVRKKKGKTAEERIDKYLENVLFDTLRGMGTDFKSKMRIVEGDLTQDGMALSKSDRDTMIDEVNTIFHVASNVKFMERMSTALKINVMGTQAMIDLAKQCKHIEGFMYVSTVFSHCYKKNIMEVTYPSPAGMKLVKDLIAADLATPTGLNDAALSDILGEFPNTYTFTKAIAEGLVDDAGKQALFPCIIHRPSIVTSSWKEPVKGWCANLNGPGIMFAGYLLGIIHVVLVDDLCADLIPVDMAINSMLVSMWDAVKERPRGSGALVYNYGSSVVNPISYKSAVKMILQPGDKVSAPSTHTIWKNFIYYTKYTWLFAILNILFHFLPAMIIDVCLLVNGKKARAVSRLKNVTKAHSVLSYFSVREWMIDITETNKAVDRMSTADHELFFCDVRQLDWHDYFSGYWHGLRVYGLNDPMSTVPAAERKVRIITAVHYIAKYTILLSVAYATLRVGGQFLNVTWLPVK